MLHCAQSLTLKTTSSLYDIVIKSPKNVERVDYSPPHGRSAGWRDRPRQSAFGWNNES
jgi:hypothetical protein